MSASIVIVAYNSGAQLVRCLKALENEDGIHEVIVVNNGARGEEILEAEKMELVKVFDLGENRGFSAASNYGAELASADTLLFLNPDTVVQPGAVARLTRTVADPAVGAAMGRLRLYEEPELLNSSGAVIHVSGLGWSGGYRQPVTEVGEELRDVTYANGSALAIRTELFRELGGFTEELFAYHEDLELGWRLRMRGLRNVLDPGADVLHDYEHGRNPRKNYLMERNRLVFVATAYPRRTLGVLLPVLAVAELGLTLVALREGWFRDKAAGWVWCVRHLPWVRRHRRRLQAGRTVTESELAASLTARIEPGMIDVPRLVRLANPLLERYWSLVRRLL